MNRCSVCGDEVRYFGGLVARDPLTDEPHVCALPPAGRALLCVCELLVYVLEDGARINGDGRSHVHVTAASAGVLPASEGVPTGSAPHPTDSDYQAPQRREPPPMPAPKHLGGWSSEIEVIEE